MPSSSCHFSYFGTTSVMSRNASHQGHTEGSASHWSFDALRLCEGDSGKCAVGPWAVVLAASRPRRRARSSRGPPCLYRCHHESESELIADTSLNSDFCKNGNKYGGENTTVVLAKNGLRTKTKNKKCLLYLLETNEWYQVKNICLCLLRFKAYKFAPYFNFLRALEEVRIAYSEAD